MGNLRQKYTDKEWEELNIRIRNEKRVKQEKLLRRNLRDNDKQN